MLSAPLSVSRITLSTAEEDLGHDSTPPRYDMPMPDLQSPPRPCPLLSLTYVLCISYNKYLIFAKPTSLPSFPTGSGNMVVIFSITTSN